ncbi:MAG TPA: A/G-specific adenine glycosylase, partial [Solirubrobacteraceae bacterium]|nr:A/G-specific adenine glycosylase [Solirubrobacteraceae bacterium]
MAFDAVALLDWYARVRRPLPWRATRDPYALLVSEVMLQQTQVARVIPYYEAFLDRFPDAAALAAAAPRDVLAAWSGLGYSRRALALQAAARVVDERGWPADLTELPGVGPYTAAAVGSFAWDRQEPAVDTNVRRVFARHDGVARGPAALA